MNDTHRKISYLDAVTQAQAEEMSRDERVVLLGQDTPLYTTGGHFDAIRKDRIRTTPISELGMAGIGVGAALTGLRPIIDLTMSSFIYLASDQIINQAAKLRYMTGGKAQVPLVIRTCMYYNASVAAQHSDRSYTLFMNTPGLKIVLPATPSDVKGLLKSAIRDDDPVLVFEDVNLWAKKELVPTDPDYLVPIGKADIKKAGSDVTVVSIGGCLHPALKAAKALEDEGVSVEVIDPRTIVPLDKETILKSVAKTGRLVIVDNAHRTGSVASEIAAVVAEEGFDCLRKPVQLVTTPDVQIPFSPALEKPLYPSQQYIINAVKKLG